MKKRFLAALAALGVACVMSAGVTAFAGIGTNSPVGNGLLENGELNTTSFMKQDDTDPSAYSIQKGNSTYQFSNVGWRAALVVPLNAIPAADLVAESTITMQFDVYQFGTMWEQCAYFSPFSSITGWGENYLAMRINAIGPHFLNNPTGNAQISVKGGEFSDLVINDQTVDVGFQGNVLDAQKQKGADYATFWFEYDISDYTMTVYAGNAETGKKTLYSVMSNAFTLKDGAEKYYMNFAFDGSAEIDNFKVYRTLNDETKSYADFDFSDSSLILPTGSAEPEDANKLTIQIDSAAGGSGAIKMYDSSVIVKNPAQDTRISTLNPLRVDTSMTKTFEMNAGFNFKTLAQTRKVGIAFGLARYDTKLSSPADGASFVYFTLNQEGKLLLGADNIAADGTATATGGVYALDDIALGSNVIITVSGKQDNSVDVQIGEDIYNFPDMKLSGNLAFAQTGTGDVEYSILADAFKVTGYSFTENEATEAVHSSFENNYLSQTKFAVQSNIAPEEYIVKQDTTTHEISGISVENGRVGFYGTSTNSRMMFNQRYSDFVLQFDYVSEAFSTRALPGGITTGGTPNRFSPFYVLFGSENQISELALTYAIGIVEGNATQYFWGAESLLSCDGKLINEGVKVLANMKTVEQADDTIPCYGMEEGKGYVVKNHGLPDEEADSYVYSFYNRISRVKLVCVNNVVAMYAATVAEDGSVGEYVKLMEAKVTNSDGYVGFGTDAPGWAAIDNVCITPISKEKALELGIDAVPAVDLVADVNPADMDTDPEPTPLAKTQITVDTEGKKVTWTAVEGAKEYKVTVKLGSDEKISKTVTDTQLDLSSLTESGEYTVTVEAIPEDAEKYMSSTQTAKYTVSASSGGTDGGSSSGGCSGSLTAIGEAAASVTLLSAAAVIFRKRRS